MKKDKKDDVFLEPIWRKNWPNGGASWAAWEKPTKPEPIYIPKDEWPSPKERTDLVFAKSCVSKNWCSTDAGSATEPASNFGNIMVPLQWPSAQMQGSPVLRAAALCKSV